MPFQLYTVNHLTHEISQVAAAADQAHYQEPTWRDTPGVHSLVTLVTCNRVEIYVSADPSVRLLPCVGESGEGSALKWNFLEGREVAEHLFRVASGLDSMVVGEAEVAGQVRRAFTRAREQGTVKGLMVKMFEEALATARHVATQTELTGLGRSVVSVALDLAATQLPLSAQEAPAEKQAQCQDSMLDVVDDNPGSAASWQGLKALLVGTGAYAGATVAQLRARGVKDIANIQTSQRVVSFSTIHRTRVVEPGDTVAALHEADLVVACRGLGSPVLSTAQVAQATSNRKTPLVILDLALHADVEPTVRDLPGVKLWNLEDIHANVPALAVSQIQRAHELIAAGLANYDAAVAARHMDPAIVQLRALFEAAAQEELAALPQGEMIPREDAERAIWHVVKKLAHTPTVSAHMAAESGLGAQWVDALATVWGLTPEVLEDAFSGVRLNQ